MLILSEFDIQFHVACPTAVIGLLHLHPSLQPRLRAGNDLLVEHIADFATGDPTRTAIPSTEYIDAFGNRCARFMAPAGQLRLSGTNLIEADDSPDPIYPEARQAAIEDLPSEVLQFLLPSRYCEVDRFGAIAHDLFADVPAGWQRALAIRDWVHEKVVFNYNAARPTKTALDVYTERIGVCRDFQHLAITLSRCQNIPARYVTGYIGDIRMPSSGPGDFSAWYQVFLDGQWIDLDARHNYRRLGRILMATGQDAADVAITTSFGSAHITRFYVESNEVDAGGDRIARPLHAWQIEPPPPPVPEINTPTQSNPSESSASQAQAATT